MGRGALWRAWRAADQCCLIGGRSNGWWGCGTQQPTLPAPITPLQISQPHAPQLLVYTWRSEQIKDKSASLYDDRRGPLGLAGIIVAALSLIFLVALADFVKVRRGWLD